jgi:hypothetical protein
MFFRQTEIYFTVTNWIIKINIWIGGQRSKVPEGSTSLTSKDVFPKKFEQGQFLNCAFFIFVKIFPILNVWE